MAIGAENIDSENVDSESIDSEEVGNTGMALTERAFTILNDANSTQVFAEGTWNLIDNFPGTNNLFNPSNVDTGWDIANTTYGENGLSLAALPFYDAGVYAIARCVLSAAASFTLTITGLNNSSLYSFIFSGATSSGAGAGTRVMTITSSVSAMTATILTDSLDPTNDHIDSIDLQLPSAGTIVLTLTNTGVNQVQCSTFEIQEFT